MTRREDLMALGQSRAACSPENLRGLVSIVEQVKDIPGDIVEVGSYKCGSTIILATTAEEVSPEKKVFAFDTFAGMPAAKEFDYQGPLPPFNDVNFGEIQSVTSLLPSIQLVRGIHEKTIPEFESRPVSFIFMDSDLYSSHIVTLKHLWPMLSVGGIITFHDWNTIDCPGVKKAIEDFFDFTVVKQALLFGMLSFQK